MFPIDMKHIGKIDAVGTVQVFGYSSRRIDEHVSDMTYLNFAGPATAAASVWAIRIDATHSGRGRLQSYLVRAPFSHLRNQRFLRTHLLGRKRLLAK